MSTQTEILSELMGADAVDAFFNDYWPNRVFVAEGDKERLPAALLHAELNDFDSLSLRYKGVVSFFGVEGLLVPQAAEPPQRRLSL